MALQKQTFPVSLAEGTDTKDDAFQIPPPKLLALTNGMFQTPGSIRKRPGQAALGTSILGGGNVSSGVLLSNFQNETIECDGNSLYSYSTDLGDWVNKGTLVNCAGAVSVVSRSGGTQSNPDGAYHAASGLKCFVFIDTGIVSYSVQDTTTGLEIVNDVALASSSFTQAKVLTVGSNFLVILKSSGHLSYIAIPVATPQTPGSITTLTSTSSADWDATLINGSAVVAWVTATPGITVVAISSTIVVGTPHAYTGITPTGAISITGDASNQAWIAWLASGGFVAMVLNAALTSQVLVPTLVASSQMHFPYVNITGVVQGTTATYFVESLPDSTALGIASNPHGNVIYSWTLTVTGTTASGNFGPNNTYISDLGLAGKAFVYNSQTYFLAIYAGTYVLSPPSTYNLETIEPTLFLVNGFGVAVAKFAKENAGTYFTNGLLPESPSVSAGNYFFPIQETVTITTVSAIPVFTYGISQATLNFTPNVEPPNVQIGNSLIIASGIVSMYDGKQVCEQNFNVYPENISGALFASGGIGPGLLGTVTVGQIQYQATWEWADGQGQTHRSSPSTPLTVAFPVGSTAAVTAFSGTTSAGIQTITSVVVTGIGVQLFVGQTVTSTAGTPLFPSTTVITAWDSGTGVLTVSNPANASGGGQTFTTPDIYDVVVRVPPIPLTQKPIGGINAVIYRTTTNGTVFYKVGSVAASLTSGVIYQDGAPDSLIVGNPQIYTTGEVEDSAPPQFSAMTTFKSRAIGIPTENPYGFQYTKQVVPAPAGTASNASPAEFSSFFSQNCDSKGGQLYAVGPLDDKLILFKSQTIFYMAGTGPAASGAQNDFTDPQLVNSNVGTTNPASVISMPDGLMFQSGTNGIWLMDRSLGVSYVGAGVDAFNQYTVVSAKLVSSENQVRFVISNGMCLVYDYYVKQWATWTNFPGTSAAVYNGNFAYVTSGGVVNYETPNSFTDNGAFVQLSWTTAWIQLAKLQGFQRVWTAYILGTWKSAHTLGITVQTDFNATPVQTISIPVLTQPTGAYQYRIHLLRQKCESMQFTVQDTQSSIFGEGYAVSGLTLDVGVEIPSGVKLPAAKSY